MSVPTKLMPCPPFMGRTSAPWREYALERLPGVESSSPMDARRKCLGAKGVAGSGSTYLSSSLRLRLRSSLQTVFLGGIVGIGKGLCTGFLIRDLGSRSLVLIVFEEVPSFLQGFLKLALLHFWSIERITATAVWQR